MTVKLALCSTRFCPSITLLTILILVGRSILSELFKKTIELKLNCLHVDQLRVKSLRIELLESKLIVAHHLDSFILICRLDAHALNQVLLFALLLVTLEFIVEVRLEDRSGVRLWLRLVQLLVCILLVIVLLALNILLS